MESSDTLGRLQQEYQAIRMNAHTPENPIIRSYAFIRLIRADGSVEETISPNLRTTVGFAAFADWLCSSVAAGDFGTATSVAATTITDTGKTWTVNGWSGRRALASSTAGIVYGNITSNTATVITIDAWRKLTDSTTATTPSGTPSYGIAGRSGGLWIALSTDTAAPAAGDTTLAGEVSSNGVTRSLADSIVYDSTAKTLTLSKTYSVTGSVAALYKVGLFGASANGDMFNEALLSPSLSASSNGDTLVAGWVFTLS